MGKLTKTKEQSLGDLSENKIFALETWEHELYCSHLCKRPDIAVYAHINSTGEAKMGEFLGFTDQSTKHDVSMLSLVRDLISKNKIQR